ncbi:hypothetical protein AB4144_11540, partial [Rhizobiaceae sp. 2RAB30]
MAITIAQFLAGENDTEIADSAANFAAASAGTFGEFGARGVSLLTSTEGAIALSVAQVGALAGGETAFAPGDTITVADTGAAIAALTSLDFASLGSVGVDRFDATSDVRLSIEQMRAVVQADMVFDAGDMVIVSWGADAQEMASLAAAGADRIHVNGPITLTTGVEKLFAMAAAGLRFTDASQVTFFETTWDPRFYEGLSV